MDAEEIIRYLQSLIEENPKNAFLPVKMRTGNGQLYSIDGVTLEGDRFDTWIELA
jgi:hypothetical protein